MKEKLKIDLRRVTIKKLRTLAAVAENGTLSGAAATLNVTPPAVTLQMKELEEIATMPLLERGNGALKLTEAGQEFLAAAAHIEAVLEECAEALEELSGIDGGHVSVGVVSTAKYFAPRALAAFAKEHPRVDMQLRVGNRSETIAALERMELDFAVMGRPPENFPVANAEIADHPHIIVVPVDHPLAGRRRVALKSLAEESFLMREPGSGTRLIMRRLFRDAGFEPRLGMEIDSNETIKQAVMAGLGIALISAHTVSAEIEDGRLAMLPVSGLPTMRKWYVVRHQDKRLLPAGRALWDFMAQEGARFLPDTLAIAKKMQNRKKAA